MNAIKMIIAAGLSTLALGAMAGDIESVVVQGPSTQEKTRDEVKAELNVAIAKGEIVHGDFVDLYQLLSVAPADRALADVQKQDQRNKDAVKTQLAAGKGGTSH